MKKIEKFNKRTEHQWAVCQLHTAQYKCPWTSQKTEWRGYRNIWRNLKNFKIRLKLQTHRSKSKKHEEMLYKKTKDKMKMNHIYQNQ